MQTEKTGEETECLAAEYTLLAQSRYSTTRLLSRGLVQGSSSLPLPESPFFSLVLCMEGTDMAATTYSHRAQYRSQYRQMDKWVLKNGMKEFGLEETVSWSKELNGTSALNQALIDATHRPHESLSQFTGPHVQGDERFLTFLKSVF